MGGEGGYRPAVVGIPVVGRDKIHPPLTLAAQ